MSDRIQINLQRTYKEVLETRDEYNALLGLHPAPWSPQVKIDMEALLQLIKQSHEFILQSLDKWEDLAKKTKDAQQKKQEYDSFDTWRDADTHRKLLKELAMIIIKGEKYLLLEYDDTNTSIKSVPTQAKSEDSVNITVPKIAPSITPQMLRIPTLNIQKFNGDYLKWKTFWQRFELNVHNHPFSNVEKLDALIGLLEGDALDEVAGFEIAGENYDTVVQTLTQRFGNPKIVLKELYNKLRSIQRPNSDAKSLRSTINAITNMCRQLTNYGVNIDNDALQTEIIDKMPPREKNELSWFQITTEDVTTEMILEKMKEIALKAEMFFQNQPNIDQSTQHSNNNTGFGSSDKKFVCSFCDQNHPSYDCPKFVSADERIQQLQSKNCCTKCARSNHSTEKCSTNTTCRSCHGQHYTFLCSKGNATSNFEPLTNRFTSNPSSKPKETNTFISVEKQQGCLLAKEVTVMNLVSNETAKAVVFFDSGSQRSYITDKLINQLKLPTLQRELLNIRGIGGKKIYCDSNLVELRIGTNEGYQDIFVNSMETIAYTIPLIEINVTDITTFTVKDRTPDILIGMDYFFKFIKSIKQQNATFFVESLVGDMVAGEVPITESLTLPQTVEQKHTTSFPTITNSEQRKQQKARPGGEGFAWRKRYSMVDWWKQHQIRYGSYEDQLESFDLSKAEAPD